MRFRLIEKLEVLTVFFTKYWLLFFYIDTIAYYELVYRLCIFRGLSPDYVFPVLFALPAGGILFIMSGLFPTALNRILSFLITSLLFLVYGLQLIYYSIFRMPLSIYSLTGTGEALQFGNIILSAILDNFIAVLFLFIPLVFLFIAAMKLPFGRIRRWSLCILLLFCAASYGISLLCVNLTGNSTTSQYSLYYRHASPELSVSRLGLMTTMRLDFERLVLGFEQYDDAIANTGDEKPDQSKGESVSCFADDATATPPSRPAGKGGTVIPTPTPPKGTNTPTTQYNIMDIDFNSLLAREKDENLADMHKFFSSVKPTKKNEYTGIFKGNNLILITAEAFSPYAISPQLTPTLYRMSTEGFVFKNFYNPVWGVSTSDGEYVACTGLIPKSGVWSFARSGKNYMPFVMGNQFKKLGYPTKAYHDHTYDYYKRDISHPNMGYDYKALGKGLVVKKTWPESDLEMIKVTAGDYIGPQPFHTYYMTVSGHMNYSFSGNYISYKNRALTAKLPYSEASRAYIACNLELEFAMKALIDKLEAAGIAEKTVIAISPDHYPYGLPEACIDELAGHKVEKNFELYKSTFILWKKGMKTVVVDKPCASLDINPTLSNLFGLEYDSRLLMGSDILCDAPPLVIFSNRSWITGKARYNTITDTISYTDGTKKDNAYLRAVNRAVDDKFKYSARILETDYYGKVVPRF